MEIIQLKIDQISPNNWNPNEMTATQSQALKESLDEFGNILPIIVRMGESGQYEVIDGEHRLATWQGMGNEEISAIAIDASDTDAMRLTQILNRTRGQDNPEKLEELIRTLSEQMDIEDMLKGWAFEDEDARDAFLAEWSDKSEDMDFGGGDENLGDEDDIPEEVETRVKRGDIWQLGRHRIMCGDSTVAEDVARLMDGVTVKLLFTSPPYADLRQYEEGTNLDIGHLSKVFGVWNAEHFAVNLGLKFKDHEVVPYWDDWIKSAKLKGLKLLAWNIWDKTIGGSIASSTNMFMLTHEWIFVFGKSGRKLNRIIPNQMEKYEARYGKDFLKGYTKKIRDFDGSIIETTTEAYTHHQLHSVIQQNPERTKVVGNYPAIYPVGLPEQYILSFSDVGEEIADCFLGSGSTLIACEKTDRICYGMELSEHYCDVIIKRWEDYTGGIAEKL